MTAGLKSWTDYLKKLREDKLLDGKHIVDQHIYGVGFTPSDDLTGFTFTNCNFGWIEGFTVDHLKQIDSSSETKLPLDVEGFTFADFKECIGKHKGAEWPWLTIERSDSFEGIDLSGHDISNFRDVRVEHLKQAKSWSQCKTREIGLWFDRLDGLDLTNQDISHWWGVTPEHLSQVVGLEGCKLPKMNLSTLDMEGKSFAGVDFGEGFDLTWEQCKKSTSLDNAKLPRMRIAKEYAKYTPDNAETQQALQEKRQPKKAAEEDFTLGSTSIKNTDFSKVQGLTEFQCKRIKELGGKNAVAEIGYQEKVDTAKKVCAMAMQIAEIISPTPPDSKKERYRCPGWLIGPAQTLAWVCEKEGLDPKELAEPLRNATPQEVNQTAYELRQQSKAKAKAKAKEAER